MKKDGLFKIGRGPFEGLIGRAIPIFDGYCGFSELGIKQQTRFV